MRGQCPLFLFILCKMITIEKIRDLAGIKIAEGTNFIVDISVKPGNKIRVLLDNDKGITISDCIAMSRHIESNLDRESEDFELDVMSPGLTEPLKILRQYTKNIGKQVELLTKENTRFRGNLVSASEEGVIIETKIKEKVEGKKGKQTIINNINLTFNEIKETKIVLSF